MLSFLSEDDDESVMSKCHSAIGIHRAIQLGATEELEAARGLSLWPDLPQCAHGPSWPEGMELSDSSHLQHETDITNIK